MGIIPCEIPLLEFDPEQTAVIGPDYEQLDLHLPRKCVFAFLGGYIDRYAHAAGARQVATFNSATKLYPIYVTTYHGQEVALCQAPVGPPQRPSCWTGSSATGSVRSSPPAAAAC